MDLRKAIEELRREQRRIERTIADLEKLISGNARNPSAPRRRKPTTENQLAKPKARGARTR